MFCCEFWWSGYECVCCVRWFLLHFSLVSFRWSRSSSSLAHSLAADKVFLCFFFCFIFYLHWILIINSSNNKNSTAFLISTAMSIVSLFIFDTHIRMYIIHNKNIQIIIQKSRFFFRLEYNISFASFQHINRWRFAAEATLYSHDIIIANCYIVPAFWVVAFFLLFTFC